MRVGQRRKEFTPEALAQAQWEYEETDTPVADIAARAGCAATTLYAKVRELGWRTRHQRAARLQALRQSGKVRIAKRPRQHRPRRRPGAASDEAVAGGDMMARVTRTVAREIEAIDDILARLEPGEARSSVAERAARTLASLARTLNEVRRMSPDNAPRAPAPESTETDQHDRMPRDMDEFRRALARRIDAFIAGQEEPAIPGDPD
jgi:hypothetical protein